jgi:hypothetical protein
MQENLLKEIANLLKSDENESDIPLDAMKFLSDDELMNIRDLLLKRKANRKDEQESWYNEWAQKCKK